MALSVSYWSPMEKLILHLSPVARRRTLKNNSNNVNKTSSLGRNVTRHRNKSEPNVKGSSASSRAASLKNVSVYSDPHNSLDCDVKTLRLFCINQVRRSMQYFFCKKMYRNCRCMQIHFLTPLNLNLIYGWALGNKSFAQVVIAKNGKQVL